MSLCELLLMRTLCDAYHKERASDKRSILDMSVTETGFDPTLTNESTN